MAGALIRMPTDPRSRAAAGLQGARCAGCPVTVYPADDACPRCGGPTAPVALPGTGALWTWTVQRYAPKSPPYQPPPGGFVPFAVGYVELAEDVRVAAVLDLGELDSLDDIRIGMPLSVAAGPGVPRARPITPAEERS
ncbi:Zn-ribbon domain-containing OB-fold protein [Streptomyces violaceusniger]|uniref:Zn-ribbon domain-containing OB-fold protein n=1 Tax=Streptomyces violaceusniger TaxID=68280 RepID=UPI00336F20F3